VEYKLSKILCSFILSLLKKEPSSVLQNTSIINLISSTDLSSAGFSNAKIASSYFKFGSY
jgi:hypothetical protein